MKLVITVDVGASLTKIVYRLWKSSKEWQTGYICMSPLIEEISSDRLQEYLDYKGWTGMPVPEEDAYLKVDSFYFVIGDLAKEFDAEDRTFERKYENALYKVLAAIGSVLQNQNFQTKKQLPTWISVLLPWEEYSDRKRFTDQLVKMLPSYKFRGETIKVKATIESILVMPEGGGIASAYILKKGAEYLRGKKIGIGMFGHQNITGLLLNNGKLVKGESPKIGLTWFLDRVIELTSGLDRSLLLKAITQCCAALKIDSSTPFTIENCTYRTDGDRYRLGKSSRPKYDSSYEAIRSLATARKQELREKEIEDIYRAIKKAELEYFEKVEKWLAKIFPVKEIDYLIFSGGAVPFLKQHLESYCNSYRLVEFERVYENNEFKFVKVAGVNEYVGKSEPYIELVSDLDLAAVVKEQLKLSNRQVEELSLDTRLVDGYGIFEYLLETEKQHELKQKKAAKAAKAEAAQTSEVAQTPSA